MSREAGITMSMNLRAFLVIAALICLCVSSNVGPQFFPLPAATHLVTLDSVRDQAKQASYAPQADAQSFRVPMVVQSNKRADKEPPQSDSLIALTSDRFSVPRDTGFATQVADTVCFFTSVAMAPRAGRAPPSLA